MVTSLPVEEEGEEEEEEEEGGMIISIHLLDLNITKNRMVGPFLIENAGLCRLCVWTWDLMSWNVIGL